MKAALPISAARYAPAVWSRFCDPRHAGRPPEAVSICVEDAAHHLRLCLHRTASAVRFTAIGCPTTIAVADYCAERLSLGEVPDGQSMMDALEIGQTHRHCVLLCEDAIKAILEKEAATADHVPPTP